MHCSRVDAFRHRADPIIADPATRGHACRALTLMRSIVTNLESVARDEGHPPRIVADIEMGA
jgi:hypothetical protein